jgi:hypothetical protein
MAILSLNRFLGSAAAASPVVLRACRFERSVLTGGLTEGGWLTCLEGHGREVVLRVAMRWEALAQLRAELLRRGVRLSDDQIIRGVLRYWGLEEYKRRLSGGAPLPEGGLVLESLGGPSSSRPRQLLQACGLLPLDAA